MSAQFRDTSWRGGIRPSCYMLPLVLVLAATAGASVATAQALRDTGDNSPPTVQMVDDNGVNFWSSDVSYPMSSLSIGAQNMASNIGFSANWSGATFRHNHLCYAITWRYVGYGGKRSGADIGVEVICNNKTTQFIAPGTGVGGVSNAGGTGYLRV